jgi:hypothetical protein
MKPPAILKIVLVIYNSRGGVHALAQGGSRIRRKGFLHSRVGADGVGGRLDYRFAGFALPRVTETWQKPAEIRALRLGQRVEYSSAALRY